MRFVESRLAGAYTIELDAHTDERGFFARTWCEREFADHGLVSRLAQCSISFNKRRGTLRGLHFQAEPYAETKVVRCTRGRAYDVIVDLRRDSTTFKEWAAVELSADNCVSVYVPAGFGHGFQTLEDETELLYQITPAYHADAARGVRWNDPAFAIEWPLRVSCIAERDSAYPDFIVRP